MCDGYQAHHAVTEVFTYTVRDGDKVDPLEHAFDLCNVGADPEFVDPPDDRAVKYHLKGNRPLSVGDVVALVSDNGLGGTGVFRGSRCRLQADTGTNGRSAVTGGATMNYPIDPHSCVADREPESTAHNVGPAINTRTGHTSSNDVTTAKAAAASATPPSSTTSPAQRLVPLNQTGARA